MKFQTLPVKRKPVAKGVFRRLSAVTRGRKQRVAAAATADLEADDGTSKVSRALTIIFLIHIVALGLIFVHQRFLKSRPAAAGATEAVVQVNAPAEPAAPRAAAQAPDAVAVPSASPTGGAKPYIAREGDTYASIAAAAGIDAAALREANGGKALRPKQIVLIPKADAATPATPPPAVVTARPTEVPAADDGLVAAIDTSQAPRARPVATSSTAAPVAATAGAPYVVKPGDSVWAIASRFKVSQDALMRANKLTDARKLRAGMTVVIPQG